MQSSAKSTNTGKNKHESADQAAELEHDISALHQSCPNLSRSLENLLLDGQMTTSNISGVPFTTFDASNLLLPTPKFRRDNTIQFDCPMSTRICKSMNDLGRIRNIGTMQIKNESTKEDLFDLIERLNARFQDQRAELEPSTQEENNEALLSMISEIQSRRFDDQRASPVNSDVDQHADVERLSARHENMADDKLFELIMCYQATRIEDQRSELGGQDEKVDTSEVQKEKSQGKRKTKE